MPLNRTLKMVKMANFKLCILYHNLKSLNLKKKKKTTLFTKIRAGCSLLTSDPVSYNLEVTLHVHYYPRIIPVQ